MTNLLYTAKPRYVYTKTPAEFTYREDCHKLVLPCYEEFSGTVCVYFTNKERNGAELGRVENAEYFIEHGQLCVTVKDADIEDFMRCDPIFATVVAKADDNECNCVEDFYITFCFLPIDTLTL